MSIDPALGFDPWYGPQLPGVERPADYTRTRAVVPDHLEAAYNRTFVAARTPNKNPAEEFLRRFTPGSFLDDFMVGNFRIATGTVGKNGNPTYQQARDETFRDVADGFRNVASGVGNVVGDLLGDSLKPLLPWAIGAGVGLAVLPRLLD